MVPVPKGGEFRNGMVIWNMSSIGKMTEKI